MRATIIVGEPCTGKSTLMKAFLAEGNFRFLPGGGMARHEDFRRREVVFGNYDVEHQFPGTDRLSMAVKPIAMEYAHDYGHKGWHVLFEGMRLGNGKVIDEMAGMGFDVRLGVTVVDGEELTARRALERDQPETFLKGAMTRVRNLVARYPGIVTLLRCDRESDTPRNLAWMRALPGEALYSAPAIGPASRSA